MSDLYTQIDTIVQDLEKLRRTLKRKSTQQVSANEETAIIRANCLAWFNTYRPAVALVIDGELLARVDSSYKELSAASDRSTMRSRYGTMLKTLKTDLNALKQYSLTPAQATTPTDDLPPGFSALVPDARMREVLNRRWAECANCIAANAPLAATVMMGGLVEAILLARVHHQVDKGAVFGARTAPKNTRTGKPLQLNEWTLRNYIDVAHELGWISQSARDVGEVVRDYRNYVHPQKELSHGVVLSRDDAMLFWQISKAIVRQVIGEQQY